MREPGKGRLGVAKVAQRALNAGVLLISYVPNRIQAIKYCFARTGGLTSRFEHKTVVPFD